MTAYKDLSVEARVVAMLFKTPRLTTMGFSRPHIIHPRTRKGLDELTANGFLWVGGGDTRGSLVWSPTEKLRNNKHREPLSFLEENSFPVTTE